MKKQCEYCKKLFTKPKKISYKQWDKRRFCSKICKGKMLKPENFNHWKGGKSILKTGYIYIYFPLHPFSCKKGYVMEHRLVMEKQIGRYLHRWEVVHHINRIRDDNRLENLELMKKIEHDSFEAIKNNLGKDKKSYRLRNLLGQFKGVNYAKNNKKI